MAVDSSSANVGKIVEIKGVVIDAVFPGNLPEIYNAVRIQGPDGDGRRGDLIAEVQQHLGNDRVRAVAMDSTDGIARGADVEDTGAPITVPVGESSWNAGGSRWIGQRSTPPPFVLAAAPLPLAPSVSIRSPITFQR